MIDIGIREKVKIIWRRVFRIFSFLIPYLLMNTFLSVLINKIRFLQQFIIFNKKIVMNSGVNSMKPYKAKAKCAYLSY